jgi:hypothetical protein
MDRDTKGAKNILIKVINANKKGTVACGSHSDAIDEKRDKSPP